MCFISKPTSANEQIFDKLQFSCFFSYCVSKNTIMLVSLMDHGAVKLQVYVFIYWYSGESVIVIDFAYIDETDTKRKVFLSSWSSPSENLISIEPAPKKYKCERGMYQCHLFFRFFINLLHSNRAIIFFSYTNIIKPNDKIYLIKKHNLNLKTGIKLNFIFRQFLCCSHQNFQKVLFLPSG